MKADCRLCNQLGVQPLLSTQALKMIAPSRLLKVQVSAHRTLNAPCCGALCGSLAHSQARRAAFVQRHGLRLADGREELAITLQDLKERVDMSWKGPPFAAFSLWGDTAPCHTSLDSVMLLLWFRLTGTARQRLWFVALSKHALQVRVWWSAHARAVLERCEMVLRPRSPRLHGNKEA